MSEQIDPVAEVPEASSLVSEEQPGSAEVTAETTQKRSFGAKQWPWFVVVGVAAVTGLSGYALGHTNGEGNHRQQPVGLNGPVQGGPNGGFGIDPDGDNWSGGGKHRNRGFGQPGQDQFPGQGQPGMPGQNGQLGQPGQGQFPFGPHCEDSTGSHAPVNADGSCPTGFTLDDKGAGMPGMAPTAPKASPSASASTTS